MNASPRTLLFRWLFRASRWLAAGYLLVLLLLLLLENTLLYPAPKFPEGDWQADWLAHEEAYFAADDGTKLHGWFLEHPQPRAVVLHCHGNGEHVAYSARHAQELREKLGVSVFVFDYRGYGRSEGSPDEPGIMQDGRAALAWLAQRTGKQPADLVLFGRSLGGGVVVDLAANHGARALVLQNTFTSLPDAAAHLYPWAPVRSLMRNRYESLSKIGRYPGPVFMSHGASDDLVPIALGRRLFDAVPGPKQFFTIEGGGHNSGEPPEYYDALSRFLDTLAP